MNKKTGAFTLVELIVVITILAVLATVAFISFQGYASSSRDSVRLADLKNITKSFELIKTRDQQLPLPDQSVDITATGVIFQYQGVLEESTLKKNGIHNGGLDPQTKEPYGYVVNTQRNKFQVIGFLENSDLIESNFTSQTFADNISKYMIVLGDKLGLLLDSTTNEVIVDSDISQIDISTNTTQYNIVVDKENIRKSPSVDEILSYRINKIASCNAILLNGLSKGSGIYTINPSGASGQEFEVYCDMKTDGGGWTRIIYSDNLEATVYTTSDTGGVNGYGKLSDAKINQLMYPGNDMLFQYDEDSQFSVDNIDKWTWDTLGNSGMHMYYLGAKYLECVATGEKWIFEKNMNYGWNTTLVKFNVRGYDLYFPTMDSWGFSLRRGTDGTTGDICGVGRSTTFPTSMVFFR